MAKKIEIDLALFFQMRDALVTADMVLTKHRLAGTDQNPHGVRDLVSSAAFAVERFNIEWEPT